MFDFKRTTLQNEDNFLSTMYSPEKNQIAICLLKSNLESIENELVSQRSTFPDLDAENEQKMRETMNALRTTRYLVAEVEKLRQDNVRLLAKRMQLKHQSEEIGKAVHKARDYRREMETALQLEDGNIEKLVRQYEDNLREKADRFRTTRSYYDEEKMRGEIERVQQSDAELEVQAKTRQKDVNERKAHLDALGSDVPEDILDIVLKPELEKTLESLTVQLKSLRDQKVKLLKYQNDFAPLTLRK